jgi:hypothetical protein
MAQERKGHIYSTVCCAVPSTVRIREGKASDWQKLLTEPTGTLS